MPATHSKTKNYTGYLFLFSCTGLLLELLLLSHIESVWQRIPLSLLALGILLQVLAYKWPLRGLRKITLALMALSGLLGIYLHLHNNYEFAAELYASADPLSLLLQSLSGAVPALSPAAMIMVAGIGYLHLQLANTNT